MLSASSTCSCSVEGSTTLKESWVQNPFSKHNEVIARGPEIPATLCTSFGPRKSICDITVLNRSRLGKLLGPVSHKSEGWSDHPQLEIYAMVACSHITIVYIGWYSIFTYIYYLWVHAGLINPKHVRVLGSLCFYWQKWFASCCPQLDRFGQELPFRSPFSEFTWTQTAVHILTEAAWQGVRHLWRFDAFPHYRGDFETCSE